MTAKEFIRNIYNLRKMNGEDISRSYLFKVLGASIMYLFNFNEELTMDDCSYLRINGEKPSIDICITLRGKSFKVIKYDPIKFLVYFETEYGQASNKLICFKSNT